MVNNAREYEVSRERDADAGLTEPAEPEHPEAGEAAKRTFSHGEIEGEDRVIEPSEDDEGQLGGHSPEFQRLVKPSPRGDAGSSGGH